MNREILFRGKKIYNGEWVEGGILQTENWASIFVCKDYQGSLNEAPYSDVEEFDVIPETVGEFTGLLDKNGKKIFEGDIVDFDDEVWEIYYTSCGNEYDSWEVKNCGVVGFDEDRSCFDFIKYKFTENSVEADLHENHDIEFAEFISELEVIGNIHDNPDLIKREG